MQELNDKAAIVSFLRQDPFLHLYSIGDLDPFFWDRSRYLALADREGIRAIFLLYSGDPECPTLLALEESDPEAAKNLLAGLAHQLPERFYAHVSAYLVPLLESSFRMNRLGHRVKMKLHREDLQEFQEISGFHLRQLVAGDLTRIETLLEEAYPQNWFDSRMLATGKYLGVGSGPRLIAMAGVHVYSAEYRVAALGNITTHPEFRGQGLGSVLTSRLCSNLFESVDYIGLNVDETNRAAIHCYERVGFRFHSRYDEFLCSKKG